MQKLLVNAGLMAYFDKDQDGTFELEEVLETMDKNKDGHVSLEEFFNAVTAAKEKKATEKDTRF